MLVYKYKLFVSEKVEIYPHGERLDVPTREMDNSSFTEWIYFKRPTNLK